MMGIGRRRRRRRRKMRKIEEKTTFDWRKI